MAKKRKSDEEMVAAFYKDVGTLTAEIGRLRTEHDSRLLMSYLLGHAISLGQGLTVYGCKKEVLKMFEVALATCTDKPDVPPMLIPEANQTSTKQ